MLQKSMYAHPFTHLRARTSLGSYSADGLSGQPLHMPSPTAYVANLEYMVASVEWPLVHDKPFLERSIRPYSAPLPEHYPARERKGDVRRIHAATSLCEHE